MIHYIVFFRDSTIKGAYFTEHWYKKFPGDVDASEKIEAGISQSVLEHRGYIRNPHLDKPNSTGFSIEEMIQADVAVLTAIFKTDHGVFYRIMRYELTYHDGPEVKTL